MEFTSAQSRRMTATHSFDVTCPWCQAVESVTVRINASNSHGGGWDSPTTFVAIAPIDPKSRIAWQHACTGPQVP